MCFMCMAIYKQECRIRDLMKTYEQAKKQSKGKEKLKIADGAINKLYGGTCVTDLLPI